MEKDYYIIHRVLSNNWGANTLKIIGYFYSTEDLIKEKVSNLNQKIPKRQSNYYKYGYIKISEIAEEL